MQRTQSRIDLPSTLSNTHRPSCASQTLGIQQKREFQGKCDQICGEIVHMKEHSQQTLWKRANERKEKQEKMTCFLKNFNLKKFKVKNIRSQNSWCKNNLSLNIF